ncbi:MAG: calcium-binding protein [Kordiimonas sp.]
MTLATAFPKFISVFGVAIRGSAATSDAAMQHAAKIMAQYLDNNEDGIVDNQAVLDKMLSNKATMVISSTPEESEKLLGQVGNELNPLGTQDLYESEMNLAGNGVGGKFDASLEEVLHLVTHAGYQLVYPEVFGEKAGSAIANAMDTARGGHFQTPPAQYPAGAWYTYDDQTADYGTMITEYTYWGLTSLLGGQSFSGRLDAIQNEWRPNTADKLKATDPALHKLLTDGQYKLPTVLPDTEYKAQTFTVGDGSTAVASTDGNDKIDGTAGDDNLMGGNGNDTIKGGAGSDTIDAGNGNDVVWAGAGDAGDDSIEGGSGNDVLGAGAGNDTITGGTGSDKIYASSGNDSAVGGADSDIVWGGSGADTLSGDGEADTLGGGAGDDSLSGGDGDDVIFASVGDDALDGGTGNDTMWGGAGNDTFSGGAGKDVFAFATGHDDDVITDFVVGEDTLNLANTTTDFDSITDVSNAATAQSGGIMIDLGDGDSLLLSGLSLADLANITVEF